MIQTNHSLITAKGTTSFYHRESGVVKETVKTATIKICGCQTYGPFLF